MSSLSAPSSRARPAPATAAIVLLILDGLWSLTSIVAFLSGATIPAGILAIQVILGVAAIIAAVGLWGLHKWAAVLGTVAAVLILLISATGVFKAPTAPGKVIAAIGVILSIAVIVMVTLPGARRSYD